MPKRLPPIVKIHGDAIVDGLVHRHCPRCEILKPMDMFGLRNMKQADGTTVVREQTWCRSCRSSRTDR